MIFTIYITSSILQQCSWWEPWRSTGSLQGSARWLLHNGNDGLPGFYSELCLICIHLYTLAEVQMVIYRLWIFLGQAYGMFGIPIHIGICDAIILLLFHFRTSSYVLLFCFQYVYWDGCMYWHWSNLHTREDALKRVTTYFLFPTFILSANSKKH